LETLPGFTQSLPGAPVQLADVGFRRFQDLGDLEVAVGERFSEDERRTLGRAESLHQAQQCDRYGLALFGGLQGAKCPVLGEHRLREPRTGIDLPAGTRRCEPVEAQVGDDFGDQPGQAEPTAEGETPNPNRKKGGDGTGCCCEGCDCCCDDCG
jgi:hypothetical protein